MSTHVEDTRRSLCPEQKADAVRLVRQVGSVSKVARDRDLTETALRHWVKQAEIDEGRGPDDALTLRGSASMTWIASEL
jgi:transposase